MLDIVRMFMDDNVIIACRTFQKEDIVENFSLIEPIISGHKISTKAISQGDSILKYGQSQSQPLGIFQKFRIGPTPPS